ncbi:DUF2272 domain-containing protein [Roseomonas sp. OT10]|uniref:DUF2272 domain-containing protein n=1 Tax=Roseomonas cutis TaxID=2897332 RepID=UPI001E5FD10E|nr:DUF2272 domain-containing protein [Roseomonas sp. OT10]UFN50199.1 DUF2272 domain-containing protein [Roseomonas sp. OT10]
MVLLRGAALLAPLALLACAAPAPVAVREAPLSYPPSVRDRIQRFALGEWHEWGGVVVEPGLRRPAPRGQAGPESRTEAFPRVLAYWRAVPDEAGAIRRNRSRYAAALQGVGDGAWGEPAWSAAFVSWVMRSAGVDSREFPGSAAHAFYLDGLLADARDFPASAPFVPHAVSERAPQTGDLVCADRSRRPLSGWEERMAETGQFRPMHCDIVVRAGPFAVEAVGGNVADAVTLSRFAADGTGRLLPRPPGEPAFFVVMENRLGRLPPFDAVPAPAAPAPIPPGVPGS